MTADIDRGGDNLGRGLRIAAWGGAAGLMLLPLLAMQVTEGMVWTPFDFMLWGTMLLVAVGAFEVMMRMSRNWAYRIGAAVAVGTAFLLVWVNLAVGIIGNEGSTANLLYAGVLGLGVVGAVVSRFRAQGLATTLVVMAVAQGLIGAAALGLGWSADGENWPGVIIVVSGFFAALWLVAAGLFRRAARGQARRA